MVQFNTRANEILLKLVYYGPGLSGKTTNLQSLHTMCSETRRGEMFSVNTQEDRTLFFDLLPISLGYLYGNAIHLQVYTVPGQVQYDASRRVVLGGADGVVFVADSAEAKMQDNIDSLSNLYHNLNANRLNIKQIPFVLQFNKRDLPDAMPVGVMNRRLNFRDVPFFEAVASRGAGVKETFMSIARETVGHTFKKYHLDKKVKGFDELLEHIDHNLRESLKDLPQPEPVQPNPDSTVLRHTNVSIDTLEPGKIMDPQELLENALKANMETARLYSDLKAAKEALEQKNEELSRLNTQLERAHQENLKTRRFLESLVQNIGDALVSFSSEGRVLTWNAAAERIFGYGRADIVGKPFSSLLAPGGLAEDGRGALQRVGQGEVLRGLAGTCRRRGGESFSASITFAPVRGADDRVLAVSALIRDLDERPETSAAPKPVDGAASRRILLVDDEVTILECMAEAAEAWGYKAVACARGEDAVRALQGGDFDAVVSDVRMPGLSGMDLYDWILAQRPDMKARVLFTTGDAFDGTTQDFLQRYSLPHLSKPFDLSQLRQGVESLLGA